MMQMNMNYVIGIRLCHLIDKSDLHLAYIIQRDTSYQLPLAVTGSHRTVIFVLHFSSNK